jgi:hypothetical protein
VIIKYSWFLVISFLLLWFELLFAKVNIIFPAAFVVCFYLGVAYNIRVGLTCGLILAVISEIIFARRMTILPLFVLLIAFNYAWGRFGDRTSIINHAISGFLLATVYSGFYVFTQNLYESGWYLSISKTVLLLSLAVFSTALVLPLLIHSLDWLASRMNVRQFMKEHKELKR